MLDTFSTGLVTEETLPPFSEAPVRPRLVFNYCSFAQTQPFPDLYSTRIVTLLFDATRSLFSFSRLSSLRRSKDHVFHSEASPVRSFQALKASFFFTRAGSPVREFLEKKRRLFPDGVYRPDLFPLSFPAACTQEFPRAVVRSFSPINALARAPPPLLCVPKEVFSAPFYGAILDAPF